MNRLIAVATALALAGCLGANKVGEPAPDFSLTSSTGKPLSLDAYAGKPLVLMFGSVNGCESCITEAKNVIRPLSEEQGSKLAFLTISIVPTLESDRDLENFKRSVGATWDFARDTDEVTKAYAVTQLTTVVVLDAKHQIVLQKVEPTKDEIKKALGL